MYYYYYTIAKMMLDKNVSFITFRIFNISKKKHIFQKYTCLLNLPLQKREREGELTTLRG